MQRAQTEEKECLRDALDNLGITCVQLKAEKRALEEKLCGCEKKLKQMETLLEEKEKLIIALQRERVT